MVASLESGLPELAVQRILAETLENKAAIRLCKRNRSNNRRSLASYFYVNARGGRFYCSAK